MCIQSILCAGICVELYMHTMLHICDHTHIHEFSAVCADGGVYIIKLAEVLLAFIFLSQLFSPGVFAEPQFSGLPRFVL